MPSYLGVTHLESGGMPGWLGKGDKLIARDKPSVHEVPPLRPASSFCTPLFLVKLQKHLGTETCFGIRMRAWLLMSVSVQAARNTCAGCEFSVCALFDVARSWHVRGTLVARSWHARGTLMKTQGLV